MGLMGLMDLQAQTTKNIALSNKAPVTEELTFDKGDNITVRFLFDEDSNSLTVSVTSPKRLFVFWSDTRYRKVFSCHHWFKPEKLSYAVSGNVTDRFRAGRIFRKGIHGCNRRHVFYRWLECESEGIRVESKRRTLVNDSLVQTFYIIDSRTRSVDLRLRDIMTLNQTKQKGNASTFEIDEGKDFNIRYHITLQRDPCLGRDDEIAASNGALEAVRKNYTSLLKKYASKKVYDQESFDAFMEIKETLLAQFPSFSPTSTCPQIQQAHEQYNKLVDSIQQFNVTLETKPVLVTEKEEKALNAQTILANARQLDKMVSRWLVSEDETERTDLVQQCRSLISETSMLIGNNSGQTPEERNAVDLFFRAKQYFKKMVK